MERPKTPSKLPTALSWLTALIFLLLPFHALLTVWLSSQLGHYTALRLWKEFLLIILIGGSLYLLTQDKNLRSSLVDSTIARLIGLYVGLSLLCGAAGLIASNVTLKSFGYGAVVNLRYFAFFLICWIIATKSPLLRLLWPKLVLIPAAAVIAIGLLQRFVLPYDFLRHFGYSSSTIFPYETINHNRRYPRVMSTLRGANPLGAYMILIELAALELFRCIKKYRWPLGILALSGLTVLGLSFSRSAWLGLLVGLTIWAMVRFKGYLNIRRLVAGLLGLVLISALLVLSLRQQATFENIVFHTQTHSLVNQSSNEGHESALQSGLHDLISQPLGGGLGTAGPASVYNHGNVKIAENYFIQIGQETGWLGLVIYLAISALVARQLWFRRQQSLPLILLASFGGLVVVNLLSHGWTDDTIAYIWWGLAGIALASPIGHSKAL